MQPWILYRPRFPPQQTKWPTHKFYLATWFLAVIWEILRLQIPALQRQRLQTLPAAFTVLKCIHNNAHRVTMFCKASHFKLHILFACFYTQTYWGSILIVINASTWKENILMIAQSNQYPASIAARCFQQIQKCTQMHQTYIAPLSFFFDVWNI